jgi:hypothetical protein
MSTPEEIANEELVAAMDAMVANARDTNEGIGGNDVEPGQYGPDSAPGGPDPRPVAPDETPDEHDARVALIDAQVEAANSGSVAMQTGVASTADTHDAPLVEAAEAADEAAVAAAPKSRAKKSS